MVRVDNAEFLARLPELFKACEESGSVYVTFKQFPSDKFVAGKEPPLCTVRAVAKKLNLSTLVSARDQSKFHRDYYTIMHTHMTALKRRSARGGAGAGAGAGSGKRT